MSVLTHTPHVFREHRAQAAYASHIAMIKRFAAFALTVVGFTVAARPSFRSSSPFTCRHTFLH